MADEKKPEAPPQLTAFLAKDPSKYVAAADAKIPLILPAGMPPEMRDLIVENERLAAEIERLRAQGGVPEGWQLVPKEPTEVMINEAHSALDRFGNNRQYLVGDVRNTRNALRRALSAAPQPPQAGVPERKLALTVSEVMDAFKGEVPEVAFAFSDDETECGFEWNFADLSKLWLDLSVSGHISIYWRKGGADYSGGRTLTIAAPQPPLSAGEADVELLHSKVGPQVLILEPFKKDHEPKVLENGNVVLAVSRECLQGIWVMLNDLQRVAKDGEPTASPLPNVDGLREALILCLGALHAGHLPGHHVKGDVAFNAALSAVRETGIENPVSLALALASTPAPVRTDARLLAVATELANFEPIPSTFNGKTPIEAARSAIKMAVELLRDRAAGDTSRDRKATDSELAETQTALDAAVAAETERNAQVIAGWTTAVNSKHLQGWGDHTNAVAQMLADRDAEMAAAIRSGKAAADADQN